MTVRRARTAVLTFLVPFLCLATVVTSAGPASAGSRPDPVSTLRLADPSVAHRGTGLVTVATGPRVGIVTAQRLGGEWSDEGRAVRRGAMPTWARDDSAWAPDLVRRPDGRWVLFYAAATYGLANSQQRCIGTAVSRTVAARAFVPQDRPLVCPAGARSPGRSRPATGGAGFIDPSAFISRDGRRYLLFKRQLLDGRTTIFLQRMKRSWLEPAGRPHPIVTRRGGQIENPVLVQRGGSYFLFASWGDWNGCGYRTVWLRSSSLHRGFPLPDRFPRRASARGGLLVGRRTSGLCGPGGLDVIRASATVYNFVLHARRGPHDEVRRVYAGWLRWRDGRPVITRWAGRPTTTARRAPAAGRARHRSAPGRIRPGGSRARQVRTGSA